MMSFRAKRRNLLLLATLTLASCAGPDLLTTFIGTYSDGFYAYDFDQRSGTFVQEPVAKAGPSGCSVHGIFQARILEWVAMPTCRGSS